jgi:Leucine-rich repeat (LRR) protein
MAKRTFPWRPRYSLRALVFAMTLVAGLAAWFTHSAVRQRRAVAELNKLGADVVYEHSGDSRTASWHPQWLRDWLGIDFFAEATEVSFGVNPLTLRSNASHSVLMSDANRMRTRDWGIDAGNPSIEELSPGAFKHLKYLAFLKKLTIVGTTPKQRGRGLASFWGGTLFVFDPTYLQALADHPTLEELELRNSPADDELLGALQQLKQLKRLQLGPPVFTKNGADHLSSLTNLEELSIDPSAYGNLLGVSQMASVPRLPALRVLRAPEWVVTNETAHSLEGLPQLQDLHCRSIEVDDEGIESFAGLRQLRELMLIDSQITDEGARHLAGLTELRSLSLTNNRITDEGLRHLAPLKKLEMLYLAHLPITDQGLEHLRGAKAMQVLVLAGTKITDAGLVHLSGMSQLYSIDLSYTAISDEGLDHLLKLKKLDKVRLLGTRVTRNGVERLRAALPTATVDAPGA